MAKSFLADFHVHTNFSDGTLELQQVVDLFGQQGFGAIAITDHIAESNTLIGKVSKGLSKVMTESTFPHYLSLLEEQAERAWDQYKMVVIPGFELSKNAVSNRRSAHILGLGISEYLPADGDPVELARGIQRQGGVAIAAHPVHTRKLEKQTYHLWDRRRELASVMDAWEVASGQVLFDEVLVSGLPLIANSDMHIRRQMTSWKTRLQCERHPEAILEAIRRQDLDFHYYHAPPPY